MSNEDSSNTKAKYQNPFTKCKTQRQKLTLSLPKLIELDETFNIVFCCLLAKYIIDANSLTELKKVLEAVAEYEIVRDKDLLNTHSAGYFTYKNKQIFFQEKPSGILIGLLNETHYISTFEEYKYYSMQELINEIDEAVEDF